MRGKFFDQIKKYISCVLLGLLALIGLELMTCIRMYVKDHTIHAELMMLVAITAITRKIVIIDAKQIDPLIMFGIGFVVISLTAGYYLMGKAGRMNVN